MADETYTPISVTSDTAGIDWKARAEAAEARVEELQEEIDWFVEYVEIQKEFDRNRRTVTDEMVERAEAELDALFSGSPNCTLSDIARAALTAALEGKK